MLDGARSHDFREMKLQEPLSAIAGIATPARLRFHRAEAA
jgi:hypothetical protein